jgi:hypothetical protein
MLLKTKTAPAFYAVTVFAFSHNTVRLSDVHPSPTLCSYATVLPGAYAFLKIVHRVKLNL